VTIDCQKTGVRVDIFILREDGRFVDRFPFAVVISDRIGIFEGRYVVFVGRGIHAQHSNK